MRPHSLLAPILALMLTWSGAIAAAEPGPPPTVVELFTSQGCSSCPPADALLKKLDERAGVIALALHVDYWDYIGWKDSFGDPAHAKRQRSYAYFAGSRTIYTPQMIVGGTAAVVGSRPMEVADLINAMQVQDPVLMAVAAVLLTQSPWFWLLCGASVFPLAFDLKGLADSASRTPLEVVLESIASWLHLGLVAAVVFTAENNHLEWLAGAFLTSRMVYALAARTRLASFPTTGFRPSLRKMVVSAGAVSVTQTVFETLCHCDVLVITVLSGTEIAGLYAVALRIFVAVSFPAVQLARLLVPHLNHSARSGDSSRTL